MAINIDGVVLRNVPEQVSKNVEDIQELQDVSNNYGIRITALEGDAIALATFQDCTFTGTTTFSGPLNSSDGFTFGDDGYVAGDLSVGGDFAVTGSSTFAGTVTASGNENVGGNLAVAGSSTFAGTVTASGNVNVTGSLFVSGYIRQLSYELDSDITVSNLPTGMNCYYAHARISNGKLNVVIALGSTSGNDIAAAAAVEIASFSIPESVGQSLIPYSGTALDVQKKDITSMLDSLNKPTRVGILKNSNTVLKVFLNQEAVTGVSINGVARFEFNFMF